MHPTPAHAHAAIPSKPVTVRAVSCDRPGFVRYEVADAHGLVCTTEVIAEADSPDVAIFIRLYFEQHPCQRPADRPPVGERWGCRLLP